MLRNNLKSVLKAILAVGIVFNLFVNICYANHSEDAAEPPPAPGRELIGNIVDLNTGEPLGWTQVLIVELNRSATVRDDGEFRFSNLPAGVYTVKTLRVGYRDRKIAITVADRDTTRVTLKLASSPIEVDEIIVEGQRRDLLSELTKADVEVSGRKLRQNLGRTIAETIDDEPGISQRTMGPAPARPVLRGLSGDRLMVIEDGERTGDLSATSSDHAVVIEPLTAERIEVIRGPEALLYGSNTIGGVINVERGYVPTSVVQHAHGSVSAQGESVNQGYSGGAFLRAPMGPLSLRVDGSYRNAQDISTPQGTLENTQINTLNGSVGISLIRSWGYIGSAASLYDSDYGIPPDPVAGHPGGVRIDLNRRHLESKAELLPRSRWLRRIELRHSFTRYQHSEIEFSERLGREITGTGFDVQTHHFSTTARFKQSGVLRNGAIGLWGEFRDHNTSSGRNLTPRSREYSGAAFIYQEAAWNKFALNGAFRFDAKDINPNQHVGDTTDAGVIRSRSFQGFSGSLSGLYNIGSGFSLGATAMRSFRAPGIEELFSEGPHLAVYTYEIGNADLDKEQGIGLEAFLENRDSRGSLRLAVFRNHINNYIFPENTGQRSRRIYSLFEYRVSGEKDALLSGIEAAFDRQLLGKWFASGTISYVKAEFTNTNEALPRIPPLGGKFNLRYQSGQLSLGGGITAADAQTRLAQFETATDGYTVVNLFGQYNFNSMGLFSTVSLSVDNLFDTEYRKHLNWVKHILPEPGRNIKLLYKVFF